MVAACISTEELLEGLFLLDRVYKVMVKIRTIINRMILRIEKPDCLS